MITYKYRLYPNKQQQSLLWNHANKCNYLYNYFLNQRIEYYKDTGKSLSRKQQQAELVELKKNDVELKQIYSQVLQQITLRLDITYKAFFKNYKNGQGFPNFRSCKNFFGILYPQSGFSIDNNMFHTKAYGDIKFTKHRNMDGTVKQVMVTLKNDRWYLCVITDYEKETIENNKSIGIDVGITNIIATSEEKIIKNKFHAKYFDKQIKKLQSERDLHCKKGSNRYRFLSTVMERLYGVKNRKIQDFLHKLSKQLSSEYDTIFCEDLRLKEMSEGNITGLNRELRNSQIAKLIDYLQYKTHRLIKVNPRNTSKTCNQCGKIHVLKLWDRTMDCSCGNKVDRDINAAKNIYCLGQAIISGLCTEKSTIQEALSFRQG